METDITLKSGAKRWKFSDAFIHSSTLPHFFTDSVASTFIHSLLFSLVYYPIRDFGPHVSLINSCLLLHSSFSFVAFHSLYLAYYFIQYLSGSISLRISFLLSPFSDSSLPFYWSCASVALLPSFSLLLCSFLSSILYLQ